MRWFMILGGVFVTLVTLVHGHELRGEDKSNPNTLSSIIPPGGPPLVLWIGPGGTKLNADALGKTSKRLEAAPKGDLAKWSVELFRITDEKPGAGAAEFLTWFVNRMSLVFDANDKWNAPVADTLFNRAQSMTVADGKAWTEAFEGVLKSKIGKTYAVPLVLIAVDALHENNKYSADRANMYQTRLKQLTADDVSLWINKVDQFGGTDLDAAVNIILLDGFYEGERFQREKFRSAASAKNDETPDAKKAQATPGPAYRTWTSRDGRKVEAEFLGVRDGTVSIRRRADGATFSIPRERLSDQDQMYLDDATRSTPSDQTGAGSESAPEGWPKYAEELMGPNEVRIKNPNPFHIRVGLRTSGKGRDFVVLANDVASTRVPNGAYEIVFCYSTDPTGIYQGDSFTLANNGVEIQIVKVVDGNYGIRKIR